MRGAQRALVAIALASSVACAATGRVPAWELPPAAVADSPVVAPGALHRSELDNGLSVIVLEDHRLPRVSIAITVRRGAASVELARAGLASFTAEMMKRGAGDRDALELAEAVDEIGASLGVGSGWDSMTARVSGLKRDLDRILEILADVVLRPHFAEAEAARTRGEILAALERANDNPHALVRRFAVATLYPNHRAALPLSGSPETVPTLDAAMARDFHQRMFVPNNAILSASGDVEADDLLARVATAFGAWTPAVVPDPGPALPSPTPAARRIVVVDRPDLVQARISLAHEGIARTDPDRVAAALMNSVIGGGGFSSRLMNTLRVEAGLTYSVSSGFSMRRRGGVFSVSTFTRVAEVRRAIDLLLVELERARTDPPSEAELINARALAVGGFSLALETSDAVLGSLVDLEVYGLPEDSLDTYRSRVRATTTEETAELARRLLHPDRAAIILVGPAATLQPAVADLGTVEVVTP